MAVFLIKEDVFMYRKRALVETPSWPPLSPLFFCLVLLVTCHLFLSHLSLGLSLSTGNMKVVSHTFFLRFYITTPDRCKAAFYKA